MRIASHALRETVWADGMTAHIRPARFRQLHESQRYAIFPPLSDGFVAVAKSAGNISCSAHDFYGVFGRTKRLFGECLCVFHAIILNQLLVGHKGVMQLSLGFSYGLDEAKITAHV